METNSSESELPPLRPVISTAASIDQLTLSYLRGEITFQEYETMIENQHFLAIAASTSSSSITNASSSSSAGHDRHHNPLIVSSTIELTTSGGTNGANGGVSSSSSATNFHHDRFFSLKDIIDDADDNNNQDEDDYEELGDIDHESSARRDTDASTSRRDDMLMMMNEDTTTMSQWNDFDIETLNFDKFIKDHQTDNKEGATSKNKSNKRKRGSSDVATNVGLPTSASRLDDPSELKAKRRVIFKILFIG